MGMLNRLPRPAKACPKCDTCVDSRPDAALPPVLNGGRERCRAILQHQTRRHDLVKPARNRTFIAAMRDSILGGRAPAPRRHCVRFKLSLRDRTFSHVRARREFCAPVRARAHRCQLTRIIERMSASDSRAGFAVGAVDLRRTTGAKAAFAMHAGANGTIREYLCITMACDKILRRSACYLCNTHRKRGCESLFGAVPLLRVQNASVIVTVRRRGASRGRPVLGGSLKSLAFSGCVRRREAAKR